MNPLLQEIYSTIIPSAPYVIVAYAAVWALVLGVVFALFGRIKKAEKQLELLEERVAEGAAETK